MLSLPILALKAAVSAIDVRGHGESHCGGNSVTWYNANPDTCYATGGVQFAFSFATIPVNWVVQTRIYEDGNCNRESWTDRSNGRDYVCMGAAVNNYLYTGAGYGFNGKKRAESVSSDAQDCVKPDLLTMVDGQTYAHEGIDEAELKTMLAYAFNGTPADNMLAVFDKHITQQ